MLELKAFAQSNTLKKTDGLVVGEIIDRFYAMKSFYFRALLLFLTAIWLGGCASTEEVAGDSSTWKTSSGGSVPGEKTGDEGMAATAGPGSAGAGVRW